jgi:hypothetical protein
MYPVWEEESCTQSLSVKPKGKVPVWISGRGFEGNVKGGLKKIRWEGVDWTDLAQIREQVVGYCENGNEPPVSIKCGDFSD